MTNQIAKLAMELTQALSRLETPEGDGGNALKFLYTLARLESYPQPTLREAGVLSLVEHAQTYRQRDDRLTQGASESIHATTLLAGVEDVLKKKLSAQEWAEGVCLIATVEPWLTAPEQAQARYVVKQCTLAMLQFPRHFRAAQVWALRRMAEENTPGLAQTFFVGACVPEALLPC